MGLTEGAALISDLINVQILGNEILTVFLVLIGGIILMASLRIELEGLFLLGTAFVVILYTEGTFFGSAVMATVVIFAFGIIGWAVYRLIER